MLASTAIMAVLAFVVFAVFLLSLLNTPPMASPPTMSAIRTTAPSAIQGAFDPPACRLGGPPIGPPA